MGDKKKKKKKHDPKKLFLAVQKYGGFKPAAREIGVPESTIRRYLKTYDHGIPDNAFIPADHELPPPHIQGGVETEDRRRSGNQRFILTSAQNNCEVHQGFLNNLKCMAKEFDAEILASYTIYDRQGYKGLVRKGDSSIKQTDIWWDKAIRPFVSNKRVRLHDRLAFCGELDILATSPNPLGSLDAYCGRSSIIVPHNRFAFRCVEARKGKMPKEMHTTGSVTRPKFVQRKAGQLAHFHHVLGALMVEIGADGFWHVHHLNADKDGNFQWLEHMFKNGKMKKGGRIEALVLGDIHIEKCENADTVLDLVQDIQPKRTYVHDLIDFTSRNHHNIKNIFHHIEFSGQSVEKEILRGAQFLHNLQSIGGETIVVPSNHHEAFLKWIVETDWRTDALNAEFYLKAALEQARNAKMGVHCDLLQWAVQDHFKMAEKSLFLEMDESSEVLGVEFGIHGHVGPSGARGNPKGYSKLGFRTFTAHTHTPSINDGCYTVGVSGDLDMKYNRGPSKWMTTHGILLPTGKRAFLFEKNGRYRI